MKNNPTIIVKSSLLRRTYSYLIKEKDRAEIDLFNGEERPVRYAFCGIRITITDKFIEYRHRNRHLIGYKKRTFHFQNVTGIDIDKSFIGSDIAKFTNGNLEVLVNGFSKRTADIIYKEASKFINVKIQRNLTDAMVNKIVDALDKNSDQVSITDELVKLKGLADNGVLTKEEYEKQKQKLFDNN